MIIGHQNIISFFKNSAAGGTLSHAYVFAGPKAVGKRAVAFDIAAQLLKTTPEKLNSHPDFYCVQRALDDKTGKLKKDISVSQARFLRGRLRGSAWGGGYQIAVIDEAEFLNEESANALLKILEEPAAGSLIFLLTEDADALLPTVRSRVQLFFFALVGDSEMAAGLKALGYSSGAVAAAVAGGWGRPGRVLDFLQNPENLLEYQREIERWQKLIGAPFFEKLKIIEGIFGDKEDAIRGRDRLDGILDIWVMLWREALIGKRNMPYAAAAIQEIIDLLARAQSLLRQNIHPRLVVEQAIIKF